MANDKPLKTNTNPLAEVGDGLSLDPQKQSTDLIYNVVMRSGGEPFGAPFEVGVQSLTEKIVKFFKQAGFFGFETMEKVRKKNRRNKFTKHGASNFHGDLKKKR